jgi:hypothetical protein
MAYGAKKRKTGNPAIVKQKVGFVIVNLTYLEEASNERLR